MKRRRSLMVPVSIQSDPSSDQPSGNTRTKSSMPKYHSGSIRS
jgi:hypothetical protein